VTAFRTAICLTINTLGWLNREGRTAGHERKLR
jgi:hypothetical protein